LAHPNQLILNPCRAPFGFDLLMVGLGKLPEPFFELLLCVVMRNVRGAVEAKRQELAIREKMVADFPTVTTYKTDLNVAFSDALTLVRSVLPQLISLRPNFLLVFDLYAELKDKQNALRSGENRNTGLEGAAAAPTDVSFPSANAHLDAEPRQPVIWVCPSRRGRRMQMGLPLPKR
jgi:hypothetical protein